MAKEECRYGTICQYQLSGCPYNHSVYYKDFHDYHTAVYNVERCHKAMYNAVNNGDLSDIEQFMDECDCYYDGALIDAASNGNIEAMYILNNASDASTEYHEALKEAETAGHKEVMNLIKSWIVSDSNSLNA